MDINLSTLDISIFGIYILGVLAWGTYASRKGKKTKRDYFLAGDKLPWWLIGGTFTLCYGSFCHFISVMVFIPCPNFYRSGLAGGQGQPILPYIGRQPAAFGPGRLGYGGSDRFGHVPPFWGHQFEYHYFNYGCLSPVFIVTAVVLYFYIRYS